MIADSQSQAISSAAPADAALDCPAEKDLAPQRNLNLLLIDAIGPFFRHYKRKRINWSKIPFSELETESGLRPERITTIPSDFRRFVQAVKRWGYNGVTLDDVAHLVPCDAYEPQLQAKIAAYRSLFRQLFEIAEEEGVQVYLTMDVMFYNQALRRQLGGSYRRAVDWLHQCLGRLFADFPDLAGVIMRFGETDGVDVQGDFTSRLLLKQPNHARGMLARLLPLFEQHGKLLIFRTWSVGAHRIGDLMWNERTFHQVFGSLNSSALVISMKYGESDFFRYLPLNRLFFASNHQKLIEFQARREYEGFGAYPSFVGWDVEAHLQQLRDPDSEVENLVGASVWCQTGGWGKLRQLTFLRNSSPWVELNTFAIARLWQGATCEQVVEEYLSENYREVPASAMLEFLKLSDDAIKDLLYIREFAQRRLYFRRLRLPPQLYVFWDRIIIDPTMKSILSCLIEDPQAAVEQGHEALDKLTRMLELAEEYPIPSKGLKFQQATFEILAASREYFFQPHDAELVEKLKQQKKEYKARFRRSYSVTLNVERQRAPRPHIRWMLALMLRDRSRYRLLDQVLTLRLLAWSFRIVNRLGLRLGPKFAHSQAMGLEAIFR